MAKKNFLEKNFAIIAILVVVALFVFSNKNGEGFSFGFNFGNNTAGPTPTPIYIPTVTVVVEDNLCFAYQPIFDMIMDGGFPHPQDTCTAGGGTWRCDATHVGCYDYAGTVDCTAGWAEISLYDCASYDGVGFCDLHNAYCEIG